ncbi:hypothetical protein FDP41_000528 [Naegleria fowleri]|uniref:Uncharacterized protein n=1 Tax=Naegleria fowleri TaxID=5763 RepID=A0A6A5CH57_NAEFO|nr:uncharacterized protein FDP41_000528 [Naegleria fowleri]KAF0984629.1 hypothetical protein FDP41_000528 [Naegleria fowleri]CAG4708638.1 unnamed protein product [Naegleria fowleri]
MSKYSSKKSARVYQKSCYSADNCVITELNRTILGDRLLIDPKTVAIDTKNYIFEKLHDENYLLSSVKYGLRIVMPMINHGGLFARLELVDDRNDVEVKCVKRERAGKRVLKGKTKEEFDVTKNNTLKVKMEFKFRETSSDNTVEKYRLLVHIMLENRILLTFNSEPFRTVVRAPVSSKKSSRSTPLPSLTTSHNANEETDEDSDEDDEEDEVAQKKTKK